MKESPCYNYIYVLKIIITTSVKLGIYMWSVLGCHILIIRNKQPGLPAVIFQIMDIILRNAENTFQGNKNKLSRDKVGHTKQNHSSWPTTHQVLESVRPALWRSLNRQHVQIETLCLIADVNVVFRSINSYLVIKTMATKKWARI